MNQIKTIDGHLNAADLKFAILQHDSMISSWIASAGGRGDYLIPSWDRDTEENLTIVRASRRVEMPLACKKLAASRQNTTASSPSRRHPGGTPHLISWRPKPPRALPMCPSEKRRAGGASAC